MTGSAAALQKTARLEDLRIMAVKVIVACGCLFFLTLSVANAQDESKRYKTGQIKVGDHVLASAVSNGPTQNCVVTGIRSAEGWRPGYDGDFLVQCDGGLSTVAATGDHVRPAGRSAAPPDAKPATVPYYQQPARGPASVPTRSMPQTGTATATRQIASPTGGNAFGSRNPRPCPAVTHQPNKEEAAVLVACFKEGESRQNEELLVDNPVVTSMQVVPNDTQFGMNDFDTTSPMVRITGSYVLWQCRAQDPPSVMAKYSNVGHNCMRTTERKTEGYCYRTTKRTWTCSMDDDKTPYPQKDSVDSLPPPR